MGVTVEPRKLDLFIAAEQGQKPLTLVKRLREAGIATDTDYAGRSLKGQLTYGQKHARATLIVSSDGMTLRRPGAQDVSVDTDELIEALRP